MKIFIHTEVKGGICIFKLFRKKEAIQFSGRKHPGLGILSAVFGIITVLGFIAACIASGLKGGEGGQIFGIIGLFLFVISLFGFIMSYKAFKQRDIFYRFPMTGLITNGIMLIVYMIIYILGIIR
ncbi:DUF6142 family protein [Herbinix hemicellulosilytica]|nr:DUF6142 family protein [Herbinix hemicellulosilytica]